MAGPTARQLADEVRIGGVEPAQQLVQRAEHLLGERGRDRGLRLAAFLRAAPGRRRSSASVNRRNESSRSLRPPSIGRPATVRERAQREGQMPGGLAARRIDEPQLRDKVVLAVRPVIPLSEQDPAKTPVSRNSRSKR